MGSREKVSRDYHYARESTSKNKQLRKAIIIMSCYFRYRDCVIDNIIIITVMVTESPLLDEDATRQIRCLYRDLFDLQY